MIKKVTIFIGHYGCGKTSCATVLAEKLATLKKNVTVADLDFVNPFFRSADKKEHFSSLGIKTLCSPLSHGNLDIPALSFGLSGILSGKDEYFIIDVGGDDVGAYALGRYSHILSALPSDKLDVLYVFNKYRFLTRTAKDAYLYLLEIEAAAGIKATALLNNSNLGIETTNELINESIPYAKELSQLTSLPLFVM